jgi:pyruvate/2-oxoglutarate/acetoin dehydrogenase E1 component
MLLLLCRYASVPGLVVLAPYDSTDGRGLLKAAIRSDSPVVFLEHELMYGIEFDVKDEVLDKDFTLPFGKAHIARSGIWSSSSFSIVIITPSSCAMSHRFPL